MKIGDRVKTIEQQKRVITWIDESTTPERLRKCRLKGDISGDLIIFSGNSL